MELLSFIPGRIRLKIDELYKNEEVSQTIELYLERLQGIKSSRANPVIGTLLIKYDFKEIEARRLIEKIKKFNKSKANYLEYIQCHYDDYFSAKRELEVSKEKMLLCGGVYILYKIKHFLFGKSFFSKDLRVLIIASIITFIKDYPVLNKIYNSVGNYFSTVADKLLLFLGLILTLLREGKGVFILFLKSTTDFLQAYSNLQIQRSLLEANSNPKALVWYHYDQQEYLLPLKEVDIDDTLAFYQNEAILVDGVVIEGEALVDQMYYTGQADITPLTKGDKVCEGMTLLSGKIKIRVTRIPKLELKDNLSLEELELTERVATYQTSSCYKALIVAICSYFITGSLFSPLAVLLVMGPSATNIALNTGLANYIKLLLKHKIALRNVNRIENIITTNSIAFDKTGTLTEEELRIINVEVYDRDYSESDLLEIISASELNMSISSLNHNQKEEQNEYGELNYNQAGIIIGTKEVISQKSISVTENMLQDDYYLSLYVVINDQVVGRIDLNEEIDPKVRTMLYNLEKRGIDNISVLSGDLDKNVKRIVDRLDINEYQSELTDLDKREWIIDHKENGSVIMVGDGINDIDAMEAADVSISYNKQVCHQAVLHADCILLERQMDLIPRLLELTEKSYHRIERNIDFCQSFNLVCGILAMFGYIGPFMAKGLNDINSIIAILNSARILKISPSVEEEEYIGEENLYYEENI